MEPLPVKPVPIRIRGVFGPGSAPPDAEVVRQTRKPALLLAQPGPRVFNALTYDTFRGYAAISRRADRKPVSQPVYYEWPPPSTLLERVPIAPVTGQEPYH